MPTQEEQLTEAREHAELEALVPRLAPKASPITTRLAACAITAALGVWCTRRFGIPGLPFTIAAMVLAWELVEWRAQRRLAKSVIWDREIAARQRRAARPDELPLHRERPLHPDPRPVPVERSADEMRIPPSAPISPEPTDPTHP